MVEEGAQRLSLETIRAADIGAYGTLEAWTR